MGKIFDFDDYKASKELPLFISVSNGDGEILEECEADFIFMAVGLQGGETVLEFSRGYMADDLEKLTIKVLKILQKKLRGRKK